MKKDCQRCGHYENATVFELCAHPVSEYKDANGKVQFHSVAHVRQRQCGEDARLFKPAPTVLGCG